MKKVFYVAIVAAVLLSGCSKHDNLGYDNQVLTSESDTTTLNQIIYTHKAEQKAFLQTESYDNKDNKILVQTEETPTNDDKLLETVLPLPSEYSQNEADLLSMDYCFTETEKGTDVFAIKDGEIIGAGWFANYGRTVIIRHSDRISLYCHLDDYTVNTGDTVSAGDVIGHTGSTGYATKIGLGYRVVTDKYLSDTMDEFVHGL